MRKSSIQVMRQSRRSSFDHSQLLTHDSSFDLFQKTKFGQNLTLKDMTRVTTQKVLDKMCGQKVLREPVDQVGTNQHNSDHKNFNIPEYEFLKSQQELQDDPFLKAKMKYLLTKQKPQLINQMQKLKIPQQNKRNTQNISNEAVSFTTLRKQSTKENSKKLFLLTVTNEKK